MIRALALSLAIGVVTGPVIHAQTSTLKSVRLAGTEYVALKDVARYYVLGKNRSRDADRADYASPAGSLSLRANQRDFQLAGVQHWFSYPPLFTRQQLWLAKTDVLKILDPVLRSAQFRKAGVLRTLVLDPGHGGADAGARGTTGRTEKNLALDLAKRVSAELAPAGLRILFTRTADRTTSLESRSEFARQKDADLFVSLHFNAALGSARGIETFCLTPAGVSSTARASGRGDGDVQRGNRYDAGSLWLAHRVQQSLLRATGAADRGVRHARFQVLRDAPCAAILIESGFLSNPSEEKKLLTPAYRDVLAKAIAEGILAYKKSLE